VENLQIAIDGPAGCGKSTVARLLADKLGLLYMDTGAMYRAITYKVISTGIDPGDHQSVISLARSIKIAFYKERVFVDRKDVTLEIRSDIVDKNVSKIAAIPDIRKIMVELQREMAGQQGVVMDGRDIGTHVLPCADYKFYLTASLEERAKRRYKDILKRNAEVSFQQVKEDIAKRDQVDRCRQVSPLKKADDAIMIDTTNKTVDRVINEILDIVGCKGDVL